MKLPRYSSTALPTLATLDPATAAAAAAAPAQFGAEVAGMVSEFAMQMSTAEDRSKSREYDANATFKLSEFESDPRWERDEIDGRPAEEVMFEEYSELIKDLSSIGEDIRRKDIKDITIKSIEEKASNVGLRIRDRGDQIRIRRTKARDKLTIDGYLMGGDWDGANAVITEGFEDGVYNSAERNVLQEVTAKMQRLDPYTSSLGSKDPSNLNDLAIDALKDPKLRADERIDMWRVMSSAADNIESEFYQERDRRWRDNSVGVWANFDNIDTFSIATADLSPETKKAAIMMKRAEATAIKGTGDPDVINALNRDLLLLGDGEISPGDYALSIALAVRSGEISTTMAIKLQKAAITYTNQVFADVSYKGIERAGVNMITRGVPPESMFDMYAQLKGGKLAALANEWQQEMMSDRIDQGTSFDPREFLKKNFDRYKQLADAIQQGVGTVNEYGKARLKQSFKRPGTDNYNKNDMLDFIENAEDLTEKEKDELILWMDSI